MQVSAGPPAHLDELIILIREAASKSLAPPPGHQPNHRAPCGGGWGGFPPSKCPPAAQGMCVWGLGGRPQVQVYDQNFEVQANLPSTFSSW